MKLPNAEHVFIDLRKLRDYSLNPSHPRGRHKARVFTAVLGINLENAEELQSAIKSAVETEEAIQTERDEFGQRYVVDFTMSGPLG